MVNKITKKNNKLKNTSLKTKADNFFNKKIKKSNLVKQSDDLFNKVLTNIKNRTTTLEIVYLLSFLTTLVLFYCVINGCFFMSVIPLFLICFWRSIKNNAILDKKYADKLMRLRVIVFNFLEDSLFFIGLIIYWHTSNNFLAILVTLLLFTIHFLNIYLNLLREVLKVKKVKLLDNSSFFWFLFAVGALFNFLWLTMLFFLVVSGYQFFKVFTAMSISFKGETKSNKAEKNNNKNKRKKVKQGTKNNG